MQHLKKLHNIPILYNNRKNSVSTIDKCYGGAIGNVLKEQQVVNSSILLAVLRVSLLNMFKVEETNKTHMMERIAECVIDQSLKVDDQLRTFIRNDIAEEEGL